MPPGGDPGNRKLQLLEQLPIFKSTPPGALSVGTLQATPAKYRPSDLDGGGWDGPSVVRTLQSDAPASAVFGFYATSASEQGWTPYNFNSLHYPESWRKEISKGVTAYLSLQDDDLRTGVVPSTYVVSASA